MNDINEINELVDLPDLTTTPSSTPWTCPGAAAVPHRLADRRPDQPPGGRAGDGDRLVRQPQLAGPAARRGRPPSASATWPAATTGTRRGRSSPASARTGSGPCRRPGSWGPAWPWPPCWRWPTGCCSAPPGRASRRRCCGRGRDAVKWSPAMTRAAAARRSPGTTRAATTERRQVPAGWADGPPRRRACAGAGRRDDRWQPGESGQRGRLLSALAVAHLDLHRADLRQHGLSPRPVPRVLAVTAS